LFSLFCALISGEQSGKLQAKAASEPLVPEMHRYAEKDLHVFLSYFIYQRFNANAKTIHHNVSTKKEFGEWVHPDMIAVRYPRSIRGGKPANRHKAYTPS